MRPERSGGNPEKHQRQPERSEGNPEKRQRRDAGRDAGQAADVGRNSVEQHFHSGTHSFSSSRSCRR